MKIYIGSHQKEAILDALYCSTHPDHSPLLTQWKELLDLHCSGKWPSSVFPVILNFSSEWTVRLELVNNMVSELGMALLGIDFSSDEIDTTEFDLKYQINSAKICNKVKMHTAFMSAKGVFEFTSNPLRYMVSEKLSWNYPVYIPSGSDYTKEEIVISDTIAQNLTFISGKDRNSYLESIEAIRRDVFLKSIREKKDVTIRNTANPNSFFLIKHNKTPINTNEKKETYCGFEPGFLIGKRF